MKKILTHFYKSNYFIYFSPILILIYNLIILILIFIFFNFILNFKALSYLYFLGNTIFYFLLITNILLITFLVHINQKKIKLIIIINLIVNLIIQFSFFPKENYMLIILTFIINYLILCIRNNFISNIKK